MPSVQSANKFQVLLLWTDREHNNHGSFQGLAELKMQSQKKAFKASTAASGHNKMLQHVQRLTPFSM